MKRAKANRVLPREYTGHSKHPFPATQEKDVHMDITRWSTPKSDLIIFFAAKDGEALYSQQKQGQGLTVVQIMNSLLPNYRYEVGDQKMRRLLLDPLTKLITIGSLPARVYVLN